jgi:hypothetical protein
MLHPSTEAVLIGAQAVQVVFLLLHDWIPLGRLSNLAAVRAIDSTQRLLWTTLLSALPYAVGLGFSIATFPQLADVAPHLSRLALRDFSACHLAGVVDSISFSV